MDDYARALDEYRVICDYHRAEDQLKWQVMGIGWSGAFVLSGIAMTMRYSWASLAVGTAAAVVASAATVIYLRISRYTKWRLARAWELESGALGFNNHLLIRERYRALPHTNRVAGVIRFGYLLPWVLVVIYGAAVILHHAS